MGMYTELVFGAELKEKTPLAIIEILKVMFGINEELPPKYEDQQENFPKSGHIPHGGSYYFGVHNSHSRMMYDEVSKAWNLSIRCNVKNYHNQIQNFVNWIMPYVEQGAGEEQILGYMIYEEDRKPRLIYKGDKL